MRRAILSLNHGWYMAGASRHWYVRVVAIALAGVLVAVAAATTAGCGGRHDTDALGSSVTPMQSASTGRPGIVLTDVRPRRDDDEAWGVAVQRDGKILAAGDDLVVVRYKPDGTLDPRFGVAGKVTLPALPVGLTAVSGSLAVLPNGRIIVGHSTIVRLLSDGRLDPSFGVRGSVASGFASIFGVQHDGGIVAAGMADSRFRIVRFTASGDLDRRFGVNGQATADFGSGDAFDGASDYPSAVLVQNDQRIVAIGTATVCGMCDLAHFALARFTTAGRLDPAFGKGGIVETQFGMDYSTAMDGAIQPDGKIVAAGYWDDAAGAALARYLPSGRPDPTFGTNGRVRGIDAMVETVAIQRDGKILVAGWRRSGSDPDNTDAVVARYTKRGALDRGFGSGGMTVIGFAATGRDEVRTLALQRDGKIVVAGTSGRGDFALARLTRAGHLDANFGA